MDLVQLRVEISRLLTLAAKARAEGDTAQADKLMERAMQCSAEVAALERASEVPPKTQWALAVLRGFVR
jgi:hypothetical protein